MDLFTLNIIFSILIVGFFLWFVGCLISEGKIFSKWSTAFYIPFVGLLFIMCFIAIDARDGVAEKIFTTISHVADAITFKCHYNEINELYRNDMWFTTNYYVLLLIISFITVSMVVDLFLRRVFNFIKAFFMRFIGKKTDQKIIAIVDEDDMEAKTFLNSCKYKYVLLLESNRTLERYFLDNKIVYKVGFTDRNLKFLKKYSDIILVSFVKNKENKLKVFNILNDLNNDIYFEIENNFSYAYEEMTNKRPNIHLFNKYNLIADAFMFNHPIAANLDEKLLDYSKATLRSDADVKMFMIGFGKVNQALYLALIKNNQYAKEENGKIVTYPVKYEIFNRGKIISSNINHKLRAIRYVEDELRKADGSIDDSEYYAWPDMPFTYEEHPDDIESYGFYNEIKNNLVKNGLNTFIVSLGNDIVNVDIALKLHDKLQAWAQKLNADTNNHFKFIIYVRIKEDVEINLPSTIVKFGADRNIISKDVIVNENILNMAKVRAAKYSMTNDIEGNWKKLRLEKRLSNKNSVESIIHKCSLLGLKVIDINALKEDKKTPSYLKENEYLAIYDLNHEIKDFPIRTEEYVANRTLEQCKNDVLACKYSEIINPRNVLAFLEHNRWNVEQMTKGFVPMRKKDIKWYLRHDEEKDEYIPTLIKDDYINHFHSCITTCAALDKYFDDVATKKVLLLKPNGELNKARIYAAAYENIENKHYDYEIMDNLYDFLGNDYKIVKQKNC